MRPAGLSWLCCWLLACGGAVDVELLSVDSLEPSVAEPGAQLSVLGSGLPVGRAGEVSLQGRVRRPGTGPREVSARVPARALSDDEVVFTLDEAAFAALGEHGTFEGELGVAFAAHDGRGSVSGWLPVRLDLIQPMARGPAHRHALRERAREVLDFVGVVPAEGASTLSGLVIDWTRPGSSAEHAGLVHGDEIVEAGGVRVHSLGDLAPPLGSHSLQLSVRTPPQREGRPVVLTLAGLDVPSIDVSDHRLSVVIGFVALCLLLLSPLPSPVYGLRALRRRLRAAAPDGLGLWGGAASVSQRADGLLARSDRLARRVLWPAASSLGAVLLVLLESHLLRLRPLSIYLAFTALSIGLSLLNGDGDLRARMRVGLGAGGRVLVLVVLILCAVALSGTRTFEGMVAAQGGWPFQWAVVRKPALLVAFPLFLVFAARLGATSMELGNGSAARRMAGLLTLERVLTHVVLCGVGAAIFLGGWQSPPELQVEQLPPRLIGAVLFVLKCWGLAWVLRVVRRASAGAATDVGMTLALCGLVVCLTVLDVYLEPTAAFERALGRGLSAALALGLLIGALQAWLARSSGGRAVMTRRQRA